MKYNIIINNMEFDVEIGAVQDGFAEVIVNNELFDVNIDNYQEIAAAPPVLTRQARQPVRRQVQPKATSQPQASVRREAQPAATRAVPRPSAPTRTLQAAPAPAAKPAVKPSVSSASGVGAIKAPMPGLIIEIKVKEGDTVKPGQVVAVMEAMKMENDLPSTLSGTVKEICVQKGAQVSTGDLLIVIG